jgi:hypothetical protein
MLGCNWHNENCENIIVFFSIDWSWFSIESEPSSEPIWEQKYCLSVDDEQLRRFALRVARSVLKLYI